MKKYGFLLIFTPLSKLFCINVKYQRDKQAIIVCLADIKCLYLNTTLNTPLR